MPTTENLTTRFVLPDKMVNSFFEAAKKQGFEYDNKEPIEVEGFNGPYLIRRMINPNGKEIYVQSGERTNTIIEIPHTPLTE